MTFFRAPWRRRAGSSWCWFEIGDGEDFEVWSRDAILEVGLEGLADGRLNVLSKEEFVDILEIRDFWSFGVLES